MNRTRTNTGPSLSRRLVVAVLAITLGAAVFAAPADAKGKKQQYDVDLVIKFQWGSNPENVAAELGVTLGDPVIENRRIYLVDANEKDDKAAEKLAKRLEEHKQVMWAEPNYVGKSAEAEHFRAWPSETRPRAATEADYRNQAAFTQATAGVDATGQGVRVAVLDTGIDHRHPSLRGSIRLRLDLVDGDWMPTDVGNGIDDDGDGFIDESVGHGTHVAGIIRLIAPDAEILAYRVLDSDGQGTVVRVAEAIEHAVEAGADVISVSFGTEEEQKSKVLRAALEYAEDNNVAIVAAAGNDAGDKKRYPASDKRVISVAAYDADDADLATFATHGKWVDVAAPGVDITSTIPGGGYATWSGSSMAAPFVAAQLALMVEASDGAPVDTLVHHLVKSSEDFKGKGKEKREVGNGLVKVRESVQRF